MTKEKALEVVSEMKIYRVVCLTDERREALQIAIELLEQDLKSSEPKECDHYFHSEVVEGKRVFLPCECGKEME